MAEWNKKEWREQREQLIKGKKCSRCGKGNDLVIHHNNGLKPVMKDI